MQIIKQNNVKHHELRQNNSVENVFQRFELSFFFFWRRKHKFRWRISTFVWRILFGEPRIWTSGLNLRTRVLKSVTAAQQRLDMRSGCHAAKILPVGVRGTKNVWCLSSLVPPYTNHVPRVLSVLALEVSFSLAFPAPPQKPGKRTLGTRLAVQLSHWPNGIFFFKPANATAATRILQMNPPIVLEFNFNFNFILFFIHLGFSSFARYFMLLSLKRILKNPIW